MKYNGLQPIQHTKNYSKWVFNLKLHLYSFREKKKKERKSSQFGQAKFSYTEHQKPKTNQKQ